jgi:hypothetical protein
MAVGIVWEVSWLRTWIGRKWEGTLMKHIAHVIIIKKFVEYI